MVVALLERAPRQNGLCPLQAPALPFLAASRLGGVCPSPEVRYDGHDVRATRSPRPRLKELGCRVPPTEGATAQDDQGLGVLGTPALGAGLDAFHPRRFRPHQA